MTISCYRRKEDHVLRELSLVGQALSDPFRLRIVKLLALRDLCVCELVYLLNASQSRVSQNLAILKYAGLVSAERQGRWVVYSLRREAAEQLLASLASFLRETSLDGISEMTEEAERLRRMAESGPRVPCHLPDSQTEASAAEPIATTVT